MYIINFFLQKFIQLIFCILSMIVLEFFTVISTFDMLKLEFSVIINTFPKGL